MIYYDALLLKIKKEDNQLIGRIDIIDIIDSGVDIYEKDTVIFSTGCEKRYDEGYKYVTDNPGLSADAAKYLVEKNVNAAAIGGPSIDAGIDSG